MNPSRNEPVHALNETPLSNSLSQVVPRVINPTHDPYDPYYWVQPGGDFDGVVHVTIGQFQGTGVLLSTGYHLMTAAHVVDSLSANTQVHFDGVDGRISQTVSQIHLHEQWNNDWGYDIAVLELDAPAPVAGYPIYLGALELPQVFTLVGYGLPGIGQWGQLDDPSDQAIKRWGQNQYDALDQDLTQYRFGDAPAGGLLFYDFDDGTPAQDTLGRLLEQPDLGLGRNEVISAPGDSGGPTFVQVNGRYELVGLVYGGTDLGGAGITGRIDGSFGEVAVDTRIAQYLDWIEGITGLVHTWPAPPNEVRLPWLATLLETTGLWLHDETKQQLEHQLEQQIAAGFDSNLALSAALMYHLPDLTSFYPNLFSLVEQLHGLRTPQAPFDLVAFDYAPSGMSSLSFDSRERVEETMDLPESLPWVGVMDVMSLDMV